MVSFRWFYLLRSVVGNRFEGSLRELDVDGAGERYNQLFAHEHVPSGPSQRTSCREGSRRYSPPRFPRRSPHLELPRTGS